MLLAIDIGNTTIQFAVMKGCRIHKKFQVLQPIKSIELKNCFKTIKLKYPDVHHSIICSVVPDALKKVVRVLEKEMKIKPKIVGKDIKIPIKNKYQKPKQVGSDRLVCAFAAQCKFGQPLVVIDLGTAITFEVISKKGEYEGGMIIPGIKLTIEALYKNTALLPRVNIVKIPKRLIGKDTEESILSGIFFGYGEMICGLVHKVSQVMGANPKVIVTGGYANLIRKFIRCKIHSIEKDLVFEGMALLLKSSEK